MSITVLARLAYRALQRRMLQSALFVFSIVAGVALVVGVDVAAESARRAFSLSVASLQGNATHEIVGGPSGVPSTLYRTLRVDLGIRAASPAVQGTVRTADARPRAHSAGYRSFRRIADAAVLVWRSAFERYGRIGSSSAETTNGT